MLLRKIKSGQPDDPGAVRERALRLLARREHGARELEYKLSSRGLAPEQVARIVGDLAQAGWQSDQRYVESLVRTRVSQGYGPLRIRGELEMAGVTESLVKEVLAACETDWKALACQVHARKFGRQPASPAEWQKQFRHLAARGFEPSQVQAALKGAPPDEFTG